MSESSTTLRPGAHETALRRSRLGANNRIETDRRQRRFGVSGTDHGFYCTTLMNV